MKRDMRWSKSFKNIRNLYGCPLAFVQLYSKFLYFKDEKHLALKYDVNSKERRDFVKRLSAIGEFQGFIVDMAEIISKIMNFVPKYIRLETGGLVHIPIVTLTEGYLEDNDVNRLSYFNEFSVSLITNKLHYDYSKILLDSFDLLTWIAVLMSFGVAFVVIFYMNLRLGTVRICPRKELTRPALNVLQIVFGWNGKNC